MIDLSRLRSVLVVLSVAVLASSRSSAAEIPSPKSVLGFRPGDDFRLAAWPQVVEYFKKVDAASDRVVVRELGRTTEDRPYLVAIVSSPDTIARLDHYRDLQHRVADPRIPGPDPVDESKPVVLITCSIHSSETASTLMATELLHDLAARDDPATREVLDNAILLLVPSANPDGVDKVAEWYEQSKGHAWEGEGMPRLYHKYAGHDTNRDWFMLNLVETRLLTKLLYREWFPTITYDVHQMGPKGARLFVPPFHDPVNPNLDPRVSQGIFLIGAHMAADLAAAGKTGVLTNAMYDNWWNGGNRTTPQRHNMVGVLTEAASARLASPIFVGHDDLAGATRGFPNHRQAVNFVDPWPGGWWRHRDIIDYELIAARSVLTLAAQYRRQFQSNYRAMARDAIERGKAEPPFAWVVPSDQRDPARASKMVGILRETGVEVRRARAPFQAGGVTYPAGSWIFPASQPYRPHLKDMMERQHYPARFTADGKAEPPYDVAGWTLPLQMGIRAVALDAAFSADAEAVDRVEPPRGSIAGPERPDRFLIEATSDEVFVVVGDLLRARGWPSATSTRERESRPPVHRHEPWTCEVGTPWPGRPRLAPCWRSRSPGPRSASSATRGRCPTASARTRSGSRGSACISRGSRAWTKAGPGWSSNSSTSPTRRCTTPTSARAGSPSGSTRSYSPRSRRTSSAMVSPGTRPPRPTSAALASKGPWHSASSSGRAGRSSASKTRAIT